MKVEPETWGWLALGGAAALLIWHRVRLAEADGTAPFEDEALPGAPGGQMTLPAGGGTITPGAPAATPTPAAPTPTPTPTPTPAPTPAARTAAEIAAENLAFTESTRASALWQKDTFTAEAERLREQVAAGQIDTNSAAYTTMMDYLANLRSGVTGKAQGYEDLAAMGLQGAPRGGRRHLRIVR